MKRNVFINRKYVDDYNLNDTWLSYYATKEDYHPRSDKPEHDAVFSKIDDKWSDPQHT